jgi:hypothetical protein
MFGIAVKVKLSTIDTVILNAEFSSTSSFSSITLHVRTGSDELIELVKIFILSNLDLKISKELIVIFKKYILFLKIV